MKSYETGLRFLFDLLNVVIRYSSFIIGTVAMITNYGLRINIFHLASSLEIIPVIA